MTSRNTKIITAGIMSILVGIAYIFDIAGVIDFNFFGDGWYALVVAIFFIVDMVKRKFSFFNVAGAIIMLLLFLSYTELLNHVDITHLIVPIILILIGTALIDEALRRNKKKSLSGITFAPFGTSEAEESKSQGVTDESFTENQAGQRLTHTYSFSGTNFSHESIAIAFDESIIDLRNTKLEDGAKLDLRVSFGSVKIYLDPEVHIDVNAVGAVSDVKSYRNNPSKGSGPQLAINAHTNFGSIGIY